MKFSFLRSQTKYFLQLTFIKWNTWHIISFNLHNNSALDIYKKETKTQRSELLWVPQQWVVELELGCEQSLQDSGFLTSPMIWFLMVDHSQTNPGVSTGSGLFFTLYTFRQAFTFPFILTLFFLLCYFTYLWMVYKCVWFCLCLLLCLSQGVQCSFLFCTTCLIILRWCWMWGITVLLLNSDVTTIITTITITITIIPSDMWKHLPIRRYFLTSPYEGHNFTMKRSILNKQKSLFFF